MLRLALFGYGELARNLVKKEFKLRYRNSVLGFLWSLFNPLGMMTILTVVFSVFLKSDIRNFPVFILVALLPWRFFSISTSNALWSIVGNAPLVTKVYFPRQILVLSSNLANFLGSCMEFVVLLPLMLLLGMKMTYFIVFLPVILLLELILVFGISLSLAALNVYYRDINQLWDLTLQIGFFVTPILYGISLIPDKYLVAYSLNPLARVIESVRRILFYGVMPTIWDFLILFVSGIFFTVLGYLIFQRLEPRFAEEI